jgi:hypothetical protein
VIELDQQSRITIDRNHGKGWLLAAKRRFARKPRIWKMSNESGLGGNSDRIKRANYVVGRTCPAGSLAEEYLRVAVCLVRHESTEKRTSTESNWVRRRKKPELNFRVESVFDGAAKVQSKESLRNKHRTATGALDPKVAAWYMGSCSGEGEKHAKDFFGFRCKRTCQRACASKWFECAYGYKWM